MNWEIDLSHSQVSFSIRVMSISTTRGRFKALRFKVAKNKAIVVQGL